MSRVARIELESSVIGQAADKPFSDALYYSVHVASSASASASKDCLCRVVALDERTIMTSQKSDCALACITGCLSPSWIVL